MLYEVARILPTECQLEPGNLVLVGVSGGADSICLFDLLGRAGYPLIAAYFNHNLRQEATAESRLVKRLAVDRDMDFIAGDGDVIGFAAENSLPIEAAARQLRYEFLFHQAERYQAQAVAVAHHADDQVETVLMHLLRGSGVNGLGGMRMRQSPNPWDKTMPLVRPLLNIWRSELLAYCQERGLVPSQDVTNWDTAYTRNRIREDLIPALESYNPRLRHAIWRMSHVLQRESDFIDAQVDDIWLSCIKKEVEGAIALNAAAFSRQPIAVRARMVLKAVEKLRGSVVDINYSLVNRTLEAVQSPPASGKSDLGLGLAVIWENDLFWLAAWEAELPVSEFPQVRDIWVRGMELGIPDRKSMDSGWQISTQYTPRERALEVAFENNDPYQAWIDADNLELPLIVRGRYPGDRFHPLGLKGHSQKLSDYMINARLPRRSRRLWPLVCSGDQVIWVPGYTIRHELRLQQTTQTVLHLKIDRHSND